MNFAPILCPDCGDIAKSQKVNLVGFANLSLAHLDGETGEMEHEGFTDIQWDGGEDAKDEHGRPILSCANGHEWSVFDLDKPDQKRRWEIQNSIKEGLK